MFRLMYCFVGFVSIVNYVVAENSETAVSVKDKFRLHTGDLMPYVGLGTYKIEGDDHIFKILDYAFAAGYRLIDSAQSYGNEESIGKALKVLLPKYNLTRNDIFITSKFYIQDLEQSEIHARIKQSVKKFDSEYLDLLLIHSPDLHNRSNSSSPRNDSYWRDETWQVFVIAVNLGLMKNIGVANYNVLQMNELLQNYHGIKPAVNQVEWHPEYHQTELFELCRNEGILLQAYFSLGGTGTSEHLLKKRKVVKIAEKLKKTPAQVLLRWALQQRVGIIPKASSEQHVKENIDLDFTIPVEEMNVLNNLKQRPLAWNPNKIQ